MWAFRITLCPSSVNFFLCYFIHKNIGPNWTKLGCCSSKLWPFLTFNVDAMASDLARHSTSLPWFLIGWKIENLLENYWMEWNTTDNCSDFDGIVLDFYLFVLILLLLNMIFVKNDNSWHNFIQYHLTLMCSWWSIVLVE